MGHYIERDQRVESSGSHRQLGNVALHEAREPLAPGMLESNPAQVQSGHAPTVPRGQKPGHVACAATTFHYILNGPRSQPSIQQFNQNVSLAAIPPKVLFGFGDVL